MNKQINRYSRVLKKEKLARSKFIFAIFSVAILLFSGISTGLESFAIEKTVTDTVQAEETHNFNKQTDALYHPDLRLVQEVILMMVLHVL